ncbi:hypothetical protein KAU32_10920, partial [bacterium]|nr:hypothetical protein [bacterium]
LFFCLLRCSFLTYRSGMRRSSRLEYGLKIASAIVNVFMNRDTSIGKHFFKKFDIYHCDSYNEE